MQLEETVEGGGPEIVQWGQSSPSGLCYSQGLYITPLKTASYSYSG